MKIYTFADKGGSYARGAVEVAGYQSGPLALVTGDVLTGAMVEKQSWFAADTAAATDNIVLGADIPVGAKFVIVPDAGCDIAVQTGGSLNGGADTAAGDVAAGSIAEILCTAPNTFVGETITAAGVRATIVVGADT